MDMDRWRTQIDRIDDDLLRLLNERARLAVELAALKRQAGRPIEDPAREQEVVRRAARANAGPLEAAAVAALFAQIIRECRHAALRSLDHAPVAAPGGCP